MRSDKILVLFVTFLFLVPMVPAIGNGEEEGRSVDSRQILPMTLYFVNATDSKYIYSYSTTYVFNTSVGDRGSTLSNTKGITASFYLHPLLAGDFHVEGDITLWLYFNYSGTNPNANLQFTIKEISDKVDQVTETVEWEATSPNTQISLETGINLFSAALSAVDHVFAAGNSIGIVISLSGGNDIYRCLWYGNATYDSRIEFYAHDHMDIVDAYTLDYLDVPTVSFELDAPDKTVKIRANVTDPFGGYDIRDVRCTLKDPDGAVLIDNESMALINGTPISYLSVFETQWDYTSAETGKYNVTIWAVDNNGHNWYWHREQYTYDGYERYNYADFWIGGMPANFEVKVLDSRGDPLAGATIVATRGGKLFTNLTNAAGIASLSVFPTQYTIKVYWEDVEVASEQITVVDGGNATIAADVFYPTIRIVDANHDPLHGTSVFEVHPNGTVFLRPWITDEAGEFDIDKAPGGSYRFVVKWRDVEVADTTVVIDDNTVYTIYAQVFTLTVTVQDSHNKALPGAQVVVTEDESRIVFDSKLTDLQGQMTTQLPVGVYDIDVYWAETDVGGEADYVLNDNADLVITCDVFYVVMQTVDSQDLPVSDSQVMILSSVTGSLLDSGRTDEQGLTTLRLPMGLHDYQVYWRDILVATGSGVNITGDIPAADPYKIVVSVHYAAIKVVDSKDVALPGALVTVTSQAGGVFDFKQTSGNGTALVRVPIGTHDILVQWKGIDVATDTNFTVTGDINASAPYIVKASVYYMTVKVTDSRDKFVQNAVIQVQHQNGETADSGLTGASGEALIRLPKAVYDINVLWKEVIVGSVEDKNFTMDAVVTIKADIYYVSFKTLDSRSLPVEKTQVTVYYVSGDVMDSGRTDEFGEIQMKLPGTTVDIEVVWKGTVVGVLSGYEVVKDEVKVIAIQVYYLTVFVESRKGEGVPRASVTVSTSEGATFDAGRTRNNGKAEFRVAEGSYNVTVHFSTTYLMSSVYEKQERQVDVTGDTKVTFELENYPPPVYSTVGFALMMIILLLVAGILIVTVILSRKLKMAALGRTRVVRHEPHEEEETAEGGPEEKEGPEGPDEPSDDVPDEKGEGPPGPSEGRTEPSPEPPEAPGPKPTQDETIDRTLSSLDQDSEAPPSGG